MLKQAPPETGQRIVITTDKPINDEEVKPDEDALINKNCLRWCVHSSLKHRKKVFVVVYNFAAAACDGIEPKSVELLIRRWEG
ncbi:hypothetical protein GQ600_4564 [Phytophthora cactorum]|nr:hypothetical protein GQ600_4564 [Phytophthora cactorum]